VLVARRPPGNGPVLAGVDGSSAAIDAVGKAVEYGRKMEKQVRLVAVYDPDFHTHVFNAVGQSLSPERQEQVGLAGQEALHDDIINDGLGKLYSEFLRDAAKSINNNDVKVSTSLVTGKAYDALNRQATDCHADLIVVSRHGNHREPSSRLGSNAEGLLRTTPANVLLIGGITEERLEQKSASRIEEIGKPAESLSWDSDAESRLQRVPSFVRSMARRAVENSVRESGGRRVSADDFDNVAAQFGMGPRGE
jgi:nucleotide-binding universal stress UspA family protein